jgi:uncharacterized protein
MLAMLHRTETWLFVLVLSIVYPLADAFFYSRLKSTMQIYLWNILAALVLTTSAGWLIFRNGLSLRDFGQGFGTYPRTLIVSAILVALVAAVVLANKLQRRKTEPEQIAKATENVRKLLPKNGKERIVFIAVALTAGFCEEFLYRGWLLNLTAAVLNSVWLGLLLSSLLFGFAHLYPGRSGMIGTSILGLVFGIICIASGSLLPGQIFHFLLDLNNGWAIGKAASRVESTPQI